MGYGFQSDYTYFHDERRKCRIDKIASHVHFLCFQKEKHTLEGECTIVDTEINSGHGLRHMENNFVTVSF